MPEPFIADPLKRCYVSGCSCPDSSHAGQTQQKDQYNRPVCVRCFNQGRKTIAFHRFLAEPVVPVRA